MSLFESFDCEVNNTLSFWGDLESYTLSDILENKLYSSQVKIQRPSGDWKSRSLILTTTCLYYCGNDLNPKKKAIVKWKKVEAFQEESGTDERFGFKIGHEAIYKEFYLDNTDLLEDWLNELSKVVIMSDFEDEFAVIKEVGKGNYANVYLAKELATSNQFAVKAISKEIVYKSSRGIAAVINEIEIMKKLEHPSLLRLHKVYENTENVFIILDYVEGGDLFRRILKKGKFSEASAAKFMKAMFEGLHYMHSQKIVHRDLKPENLLMSSQDNDEDFKIGDFGLACICTENQTLRCGSPGYIAPEILSKKPYSFKADIFSAGVILYILLSGRAPFYGKTPNEILIKNQECRIYFHEKDWNGISNESVDLVLKLTDPDPDKRLTAEEALQHKWIVSMHNEPGTKLQLPSVGKIAFESPEQGFSCSLMQRLNEKRNLGIQVIYGTVDNEESKSEITTMNIKATGILRKLREDELK